MSVADACLVRMAELDSNATVVTLDTDFKVYRRGRSALRLAAPFVGGRSRPPVQNSSSLPREESRSRCSFADPPARCRYTARSGFITT